MMESQPDVRPPCSLCLARRSGAKSHIYPAAHIRDLDDGDPRGMVLVPADPEEHEKRCRTGVYDDSILCHECEARYQVHDTRLMNALRSEPVAPRFWINQLCTELPHVDGGALKLSILHVLWRAHASRIEPLDQVQLQPVEAGQLRSLLIAEDSGSPDRFATLAFRCEADPRFGEGMGAYPLRLSWSDSGYGFAMHLGLWLFYVLCTPPPRGVSNLMPFALQRGQPVHVFGAGRYSDLPLFKMALDATSRRLVAEEARERQRAARRKL